MWTRRCMIVAASVQAQAQALANQFPGGAVMWTTPLSPTGVAPATHYITEGMIYQQFADMLVSPQAMVDGCASMGIAVDLATATNILNNSDVSTDPPFNALQRLGLQLILETI